MNRLNSFQCWFYIDDSNLTKYPHKTGFHSSSVHKKSKRMSIMCFEGKFNSVDSAAVEGSDNEFITWAIFFSSSGDGVPSYVSTSSSFYSNSTGFSSLIVSSYFWSST